MSGPTGGSEASEESDGQLIASHVAGEPDAFGRLVARHADRLWAVALRTTGDPRTAEDALQDAMVKAFRSAASFRGEAAVTTWLHRITVNACLDRLRGPDRLRGDVPLDAVAEASAPQGSPDLRLDVEAALARLPVEQRVAVVLVDLMDRPVDEVAATLGVPAGTVKSRAFRGRLRLAELLADHRPSRPTAPAGTGRSSPGVEEGAQVGATTAEQDGGGGA